jgi:protein-S-isoprenylcysteine O-methyltransferase Ste14
MLASLAESATILAYHFPNLPYSGAILSALTFRGGNPANIGLTLVTLLGGMMMLTGCLVRLLTYRYLGRFFRFEASIQRDHQLVTGGPYSIVRHPSYTGLMLTHPGWILWHFGAGSWIRASGLLNTIVGKLVVGTFGSLVILGTLYLTLSRMGSEDEALHKTFGKQWEEWAKRVRYMVIPGIF